MMAAMAQQDCGQCGYNCQDYSNAIFQRKEERLNLCVPGGKETARILKALYQELGNPSSAVQVETAAGAAPAAPAAPGADIVHTLGAHVDRLAQALPALRAVSPTLARWGTDLAGRLLGGARLLTAGNGGSAAEAQHLTAEVVGRFDRERLPLSAIALHADTSSVTAIGNDYGYEQVYARQVRAHARPGDVLMLFSTSGRSPNLVAAARAAAESGATSWAVTGPGPNPLADMCDEAVCLPGDTATIQETHLAALHMLCRALEAGVEQAAGAAAAAPSPRRPRAVR
jgi:phosphoheptose isomerase